jgi:hypothetical protein
MKSCAVYFAIHLRLSDQLSPAMARSRFQRRMCEWHSLACRLSHRSTINASPSIAARLCTRGPLSLRHLQLTRPLKTHARACSQSILLASRPSLSPRHQ